MSTKTRTIEIDEVTAEVLQARARERGVSVSELVSELALSEAAELDRRWAAAEAGTTVPNSEVVRWLETWGTPAFRPWHKT
jgi:predicted transcriptional regulator